ncbi:MAG: agmatinase [Bacteroidales bacterium]|nr:agmatinase [Bacteroidales bacterium]MCF8387658.1 agmatinase [Bacteroidales bacterium]MCF8398628.1 agmatinase [Bacteroidales bacterium]
MNFGGIPEEYYAFEKSKVAMIPVPYDGTSTWVKGADKGPEALLEASANMELFDIETGAEVYKIGIHTTKAVEEKSSPEAMVKTVQNKCSEMISAGKFTVTLGGEHSVSTGSIYAHQEKFEDLTVLQLDAHTDLREEYEGSKYNHACVMARAREKSRIVQVGIRSMSEDEILKDPACVFFAHQMRKSSAWMHKALEKLTNNVYLTLDLDVFDPAFLPSTGTPEPGGLSYYEVLDFLRLVIIHKNLVGFDVVELCPGPQSKASDFLAAKLVYQMLAYKYFLK